MIHSHTMRAIMRARIQDDPWPHLYVENVFTVDYYKQLLAAWPDRSLMRMFSKYPNRFMYWLVPKNAPYPDVIPFWDRMRDELFPVLHGTLENKFNVSGGCIGAELVHDFVGYSIRPHTDTSDKLITGLFYMPVEDAHAGQGTVLYRGTEPDPTGKKSPGNFEEVKTVPYVRNSALFFVRTDLSYHGVKTTPVERRHLAFDVFRR